MKTLSLLLVLAATLCTYQTKFAGSKNSGGYDAANAKNQTRNSFRGSPPPAVNEVIDTGPREYPDKKAAGNRSDDLPVWADCLNAFSTAIIAFFTILLFVGLVVQIRTSRAIERAWVMVDIQPDPEKPSDGRLQVFEGSGTDGDSTAALNAVLNCSNAGKTPAWIEEMIAKFEMVKSLPKIPNFESAQSIQHSTIPLGMAEGGAVPHTQKLQWTPRAEGHQRTDEMAVIYGQITYRDIFRKKRTTTFGYKIRPHGRLERLEGYLEYNKNT